MTHSPDLKELICALVKAQANILPAPQDRTNPFFNSKYATLNSVMDVVKKPLLDNGLTISQWIEKTEKGEVLTTFLLHISGQFMSSSSSLLTVKADMQSQGSAISYAKRYAIASIVGVVSEDDDDGEKAVSRNSQPVEAKTAAPKSAVRSLDDDGSYRVTFGKYKDRTLKEIDIYDLSQYCSYLEQKALEAKKPIQGQVAAFMTSASKFLNSRLPQDSALDVFETEGA